MSLVERLLIFLASPGDVAAERRYVEQIVDEVNHTVAGARNFVIQVVRWERDTVPGYGQDPQALVNAQIAEMSQYALFVGIMWNRIGTKTPRAVSGTVEEFDRAVQAHKRKGQPLIWFYFRKAGAMLDTDEQLDQRKQVLAFKRRVRANGLPSDYESPAKFRDLFRSHLLRWLETHKRIPPMTSDSRPAKNQPTRTVSSTDGGKRKQTSIASRVAQITPRSTRHTTTEKTVARAPVVSSSGNLVLLGNNFFVASKVTDQADGRIVLRIRPKDAEQVATLRSLRPEGFRQQGTCAYAYQDQAALLTVESVESESVDGKTVFVVTLQSDKHTSGGAGITEMTVNGYSADEIAGLRAHIMLLDQAPAGMRKSELSSLMPFLGTHENTRRTAEGVFPELWSQLKLPASQFLPRARLVAIFQLKSSHTVEDVLELKLGPIRKKIMAVRFRGKRRRRSDNQAPVLITVSGESPLER